MTDREILELCLKAFANKATKLEDAVFMTDRRSDVPIEVRKTLMEALSEFTAAMNAVSDLLSKELED